MARDELVQKVVEAVLAQLAESHPPCRLRTGRRRLRSGRRQGSHG